MSQTSINPAGQPVGVAGQQYDSAEGNSVVSGFVSPGALSIPFGCGVQLDPATGERNIKPLDGAGNTVWGINVWDFNHQPVDGPGGGDVDSVGLMAKGQAQVGRRGRFLVPIASGVVIVPGDRAFVLFESDGGTNTRPGVWSNAQAGGHYIDLTRIGVFTSPIFVAPTVTGGSANVAVLEVDFTIKP